MGKNMLDAEAQELFGKDYKELTAEERNKVYNSLNKFDPQLGSNW